MKIPLSCNGYANWLLTDETDVERSPCVRPVAVHHLCIDETSIPRYGVTMSDKASNRLALAHGLNPDGPALDNNDSETSLIGPLSSAPVPSPLQLPRYPTGNREDDSIALAQIINSV